MPRAIRLPVLSLILPALLLGACSSTTIKTAWKEAGYQKPLNKVMVLGLAKDQVIRRLFEDTLTARLRERGVDAVASAPLIPAVKPDAKTIEAVLRKKGFDALLVTRLVSMDKETQYIPPTAYPAYTPRYTTFHGYYDYASPMVYEPGYMVDVTIASLETNLYDVHEGDKLVWSIVSESFNPHQTNKAVEELATVLVKKLDEDGLLPRK